MSESKTQATKQTPLMIQYNAIKEQYPGALLLFRVGDFYETFGEDAIKASKILNITLTKRANGAASHIELAGFPYHSMDTYLPKLVRAGERVAVCDQLENPVDVKGIVKRGVTELVTPGVAFNDQVLDVKKNNYLASISFGKKVTGIAFLDISTGEFMTSEGSKDYVDTLVQSFNPSEIIYCKTYKKEIAQQFEEYHSYGLDDWVFNVDYTYDLLTSHFKTKNLKGFGIEEMPEAIIAAGSILQYLEDTEHKERKHISSVSRIESEKYVWLDRFTIRNLELIYPQQADGTALIDILDKTKTPMGGRLLKKWVVLPLKNVLTIQERLDIVEEFTKKTIIREDVVELLETINDLERLISKVSVGRINPREVYQLKRALDTIKPLKENLKKSNNKAFIKLSDQLIDCDFIKDEIERVIQKDPPMLTHAGGFINNGVDEQLDEFRKIAFSGKDYLIQIQQREIERTNINSLKIAYNKVFGYFLEVSNTHKDKVPTDWIRKQTLSNAERYITEELKIYEDKILQAEGSLVSIEQRIFNELVIHISDFLQQIQQNSKIIAQIDVLSAFAQIAEENNYSKPEINDAKELDIKGGRHPVIEQNLALGENYIPNDVFLDTEEQQIIIITGPNMAGKSALLRQTALIVLMAQMGSFVPAKSAKVGMIDKVFTRVGASDNLSKGESTFMVEMAETASILNNLSDRSLVLMDEIGRGTSTYDGVSIAWAITEHLHSGTNYRPKTLFATHYHELNQLSDTFQRIKNYNVSVKDVDGKILFLRKLVKGGSYHSFGIHVAQLAGIPNTVVIRANEILKSLEEQKSKDIKMGNQITIPVSSLQMNMFEMNDPRWEAIQAILKQVNINAITPVEALMKLNELKNVVKEN